MLGMNGPIQGVIMIFLYCGYLSPTHVIAFLVHSPGSISGIHSIQHTSNQPEAIQTICHTCTIEQYTLQIQTHKAPVYACIKHKVITDNNAD